MTDVNRKERRTLDRDRKKAEKSLRKALFDEQKKVLNDGRVEAMFLLFAEAMMKVLNYSPEECLPVLQYIEDQMPYWTSGQETLETIRERVMDQYGFRIALGGASDGQET